MEAEIIINGNVGADVAWRDHGEYGGRAMFSLACTPAVQRDGLRLLSGLLDEGGRRALVGCGLHRPGDLGTTQRGAPLEGLVLEHGVEGGSRHLSQGDEVRGAHAGGGGRMDGRA